jgi:hypothetical protein
MKHASYFSKAMKSPCYFAEKDRNVGCEKGSTVVR